jgi:serine/threonine-protein kinase HipA
VTTAEVLLWGTRIGAVSWEPDRQLGFFQYDEDFLRRSIEVAPVWMPLGAEVYSFPGLARETFHGLPGMLADVLPDRFGTALIHAWLAGQGRSPESFDAVQRLCYSGSRGMGALEFFPQIGNHPTRTEPLEVAALVDLASQVLADRQALVASLKSGADRQGMREILSVGTSAGGARAKAVIYWNPSTGVVRSGQLTQDQPGFTHWLLKFDGVRGNKDRELEDPQGFGRIEFAYHKMAVAAGIEMTECTLLHEGGRSHFVTRRFDRTESGAKLHLQSLAALAHLDFNLAGAHSYEQALRLMRQLNLPMTQVEQLFRRMVFNILARNQDDHVKNIGFLMDKSGHWSLGPAFDLTYSYNPEGRWTSRHQMSLNGKREDFQFEDLLACEKALSLRRGAARQILEEVQLAVDRWPHWAEQAGVREAVADSIGGAHRRLG